MPLPPVKGPVPGPELPGPPDDDPPEFPTWLEAEWLETGWLENEGDLRREEPSDAELFGLWPDPEAGVPDDADDLRSAGEDQAEALGAGFTHDLPSDPPHGFAAGGPLDQLAPGPVLASFTAEAFEAGLRRLSDDELVGALLAARRLSSWQEALELTAVSELDPAVVVRGPGPGRRGPVSTSRRNSLPR